MLKLLYAEGWDLPLVNQFDVATDFESCVAAFDNLYQTADAGCDAIDFEYLLNTYDDITPVNPVLGTNILGNIIIESTYRKKSAERAKNT